MRVVHAQAYRREGWRPGVGPSRDVIGGDCGQLWAIVVTDEPIRKKAMSSQRADWRESLVSSLFHALPCSRGPGCPTSREVDLPRLFDELLRRPLLQRLGSGGKKRRHVVKSVWWWSLGLRPNGPIRHFVASLGGGMLSRPRIRLTARQLGVSLGLRPTTQSSHSAVASHTSHTLVDWPIVEMSPWRWAVLIYLLPRGRRVRS
ncbi:unnamed protein product [Protopolystoma xenopodis]|uniref:Uncharacterized protein n=1 Tax=Protopolystoma xenopodis TaxID=117903 RepID=A0A448XLR7_9PLAT|nr:unnamed protein product [Protopolystoma xenopodis]